MTVKRYTQMTLKEKIKVQQEKSAKWRQERKDFLEWITKELSEADIPFTEKEGEIFIPGVEMRIFEEDREFYMQFGEEKKKASRNALTQTLAVMLAE